MVHHISPVMCLSCLPWSEKGININGKHLSHLRFADDIVLLSENPLELNTMVKELQAASDYVGLEMNLSKTKVMTNSEMTPIFVNDLPATGRKYRLRGCY